MTDRRNRLILTIFALILLTAALLALLYGVGVFGEDRVSAPIVDENVVHRWSNNGAGSFAVLGAVGFVVFVAGCILAAREWRRNGGRRRAGTVVFPAEVSDRGTTTLDSASLSHSLEADLKRLPDVSGALVGLFEAHPKSNCEPFSTSAIRSTSTLFRGNSERRWTGSTGLLAFDRIRFR